MQKAILAGREEVKGIQRSVRLQEKHVCDTDKVMGELLASGRPSAGAVASEIHRRVTANAAPAQLTKISFFREKLQFASTLFKTT